MSTSEDSKHAVQVRYSERNLPLNECCNEYIHEILQDWAKHESEYTVVPLKRVKIALFPLLVVLREQQLRPVQLEQLARVLDATVDKDFVQAKQEYLTLSIGKAKFPIGLSNVGIHERKQRQQDASAEEQQNMVLDDWCINVKRLVNFQQWRANVRT
ncbi:unnamed protein product [Kluyveromyces dobzhanskii CBS 2104]|uniref:Pre-mRNA-splicing factor 18 n=1 Tax=Kluyveromyces dobzhanskii CBS 2104 TaxID=1427455 RepID=A0A0A8L5G0_9SACH|nr:unnamed protein product [Kluyveromyces dobzhanskii CBS 2104]